MVGRDTTAWTPADAVDSRMAGTGESYYNGQMGAGQLIAEKKMAQQFVCHSWLWLKSVLLGTFFLLAFMQVQVT